MGLQTLSKALAFCFGASLFSSLAAAQAPQVPSSIDWVASGKKLLVDNRWLFDVGTSQWSSLPDMPGAQAESQALISPGGGQLLRYDGRRLVVGPVEGPLGPAIDIPSWVVQDPNEPVPEEELRRFVFWLSEDRIFVQQLDYLARVEPACRIWELGSKAWSAAPGCVSGDFVAIYQVTPGPGGWLAVYSAGEGHPGVLLAKYDPAKGQQPEPKAPEFNLYPFGPLEATILADGSGFRLSTPCLLERKEPVPCNEPIGAWRVYSWTLEHPDLKLDREGLPEGVKPSPQGDGLAWIEPGKICVGQPAAAHTCTDVPSR